MMYFTVRVTLLLPNLKKVCFHTINQENSTSTIFKNMKAGSSGKSWRRGKAMGGGTRPQAEPGVKSETSG